MELTRSQLNYLLTVRQLAGETVSQKQIRTRLGIKASSASVALKTLEEKGYLKRLEYEAATEYALTDKGREVVEEIDRERFEFFALFNEHLGFDYSECEREYAKICGMMGADFLKSFEKARKRGYVKEKTRSEGEFFGIEKGVYELPFKVIRAGSKSPSMGNRGFEHPAKLIIDGENNRIVLKAMEIYYKPKNMGFVKGSLKELFYSDDDINWVLAENTANNEWIIPAGKILFQKDDLGRLTLAVIKIKAAATTKRMPESAAEITFNFKNLERLQSS